MPIRRRAFVLLTASAALTTLASCSPGPSKPGRSATMGTPSAATPMPAVIASPLPPAPAPRKKGGARFGPDGTHFPPGAVDPKRVGDATVILVTPAGAAIRAALNGLTKAQIDAGVVIALRAGALSDDLYALAGYRNPGTRPVTICPAAGFGTVSVQGGGLYLYDFDGLNICGFELPTFQMKGCTRSSVSRCTITENYASISTTKGLNSSGCGWYEIVMLDSVVKSSDSSQLQNQRDGFLLSNVTIAGCVIAPSYYEDGAYNGAGGQRRPHTDSLQLACSSAAMIAGVTIVDTQIWASNNSAMIISGPANHITYTNTLIVGGEASQSRYPFKRGGAGYRGAQQGGGSLSAIQGIGGGSTNATDSVFIGSTRPEWSRVSNTAVSLSRVASSSSGFASAPQLASYTDADFTELGAPRFGRAALERLWNYAPLTPAG